MESQLICGECVHVMRTFPAGCIDLVVTDPPYIARYTDRTDRTVQNDNNASWLRPAFMEIARLMKPDSFCVSFYGWPKVDLFMHAWRAAGLRPRAHIVWPKRYASGRNIVEYRHEQAFVLSKGEPKPQTLIPDVLDWKYTGNTLHPTQKPLLAILPLIRAFSRKDDVVLDPFSGSGTVALAAHRLGRRYLAIELEATYSEIAGRRLNPPALKGA